jgi:UDP-glucose 4-epimerase
MHLQLKNTHIIVWSARGQQYATQVAHQLCIQQYVDSYQSKIGNPTRPLIAIDDLEDAHLGTLNLIV